MEKLQWFSFASKSSRLILESSLHTFSFSHFVCLLGCLWGNMLSPSELKQKERSPSPEAPSPVRNTRWCPSGPQVPHTAASLPLLQEQRAYDIRTEHRCVRNNETRSMSCPVVKLGRIIFNFKKKNVYFFTFPAFYILLILALSWQSYRKFNFLYRTWAQTYHFILLNSKSFSWGGHSYGNAFIEYKLFLKVFYGLNTFFRVSVGQYDVIPTIPLRRTATGLWKSLNVFAFQLYVLPGLIKHLVKGYYCLHARTGTCCCEKEGK